MAVPRIDSLHERLHERGKRIEAERAPLDFRKTADREVSLQGSIAENDKMTMKGRVAFQISREARSEGKR